MNLSFGFVSLPFWTARGFKRPGFSSGLLAAYQSHGHASDHVEEEEIDTAKQQNVHGGFKKRKTPTNNMGRYW